MIPGDVIGFSGRGLVSDLINVATFGVPRWSINHVGVVAAYDGHLMLFESTTLDDEPCAIQHRKVHGVQAHPVEERLASYDGRVYLYPLLSALDEQQSVDLTAFLVSHLGVPYDDIGAIRTGGLGFSFVESLLRPANLSAIFCSELVAAAHAYVGLFKTYNVSRWNPNRLVRVEQRERILGPARRCK